MTVMYQILVDIFLENDNKSSGKSRNGEQDWREDALFC